MSSQLIVFQGLSGTGKGTTTAKLQVRLHLRCDVPSHDGLASVQSTTNCVLVLASSIPVCGMRVLAGTHAQYGVLEQRQFVSLYHAAGCDSSGKGRHCAYCIPSGEHARDMCDSLMLFWFDHGLFCCQEFSAAALTPELLSDLMKCMSFGEFKGELVGLLIFRI